MNNKYQSGLTLIELLVAAALGLLLLGIVITVYLGSKSTYRVAEGVARSQEATRFAMHFIKRDVRRAGFQDCSGIVSTASLSGVASRSYLDDSQATFPTSIENGIFGWEFNGTDINEDYDLDYEDIKGEFTQAEVATARTANTANADQWTGNYIQGYPGTSLALELPDELVALEPINGSDIFVVSIAEPISDVYPFQTINQRQLDINVVDVDENPVASGIENGHIVKLGDCSAVEIFQNYANEVDTFISVNPLSGSLDPGNAVNNSFQWQKKWGKEAKIYRDETKVFYIGTGAGGLPSLFEYTTECGFSGGCGATQSELVEGVENMQILYGEDTTGPNSRPDGIPDRYYSADDVTDFRNITAIKLSLLVRSPDNGRERPSTDTYILNDLIEINPPDDSYQRFVNTVTISLQNN